MVNTIEEDAKKVNKVSKKETKCILNLEIIIPDLFKAVKRRDIKTTRKKARLLGRYEGRLNRKHNKLLEAINELEKGVPSACRGKLEDFKRQTNIFAADMIKEFSRRTGEIPTELRKPVPNWDLLEADLKRAVKEENGWLVLERELQKLTDWIKTEGINDHTWSREYLKLQQLGLG